LWLASSQSNQKSILVSGGSFKAQAIQRGQLHGVHHLEYLHQSHQQVELQRLQHQLMELLGPSGQRHPMDGMALHGVQIKQYFVQSAQLG
jgi:hypothetical protein